jgi:hypothetical protein
MPWTSDYLAGGAYITFSGRTTGEEIVRAKTEAYTHAYEAGRPRFVVLDYVAVEDFDVDRADVDRTVVQDRAAASRELPDLIMAAVAPDANTYGVARMWEKQLESTPWRTTVVRSRAEALRWLTQHGVDRVALEALPEVSAS